MVKTKASTTKKKPAKTSANDFWTAAWRQSIASLLVLVAIFILLGSFSWGGSLPIWLFDNSAWLVGWSARLIIPAMMIYWAWLAFSQPSNVIPTSKLVAMIAFLISFCGLLHILVEREQAAQLADAGLRGGQVGYLISIGSQLILNRLTGFLLFLFLCLLSASFLFGKTPRNLIKNIVKFITKSAPSSSATSDHQFVPLADFKRKSARQVGPKPNQKFKIKKTIATTNQTTTKAKVDPATAPALTAPIDPDWKLPPLSLLSNKQDKVDAGDVQANAEIIRETLANFNIDVEMEGANIGPRVTQYTLKPPSGIRLNKITGLESNIALDLAASSIRIEAPIPGKRAVGIEVPNKKSATVLIRTLLASQAWRNTTGGSLAFAIGKDIAGQPVIGQLAKMPHLMLAGQTGSGKSVAINTLLTSLLYRHSPSELKLILVDPKQVELAPYHDIPHLLTPVIVEPEKCISALKWSVNEMERRLKTFAKVNKRNIFEFNSLQDERSMPFIVIVIDELADLMMMAARDVEALIVRIAQKARAAGIHLVLATQRPSVDVITGLIKANVPARIAFTTASQIDSRTIIDQVGAEKLLGYGDILFMTAQTPKPRRVQGAFVSDNETTKICDFLRQLQQPQYDDDIISQQVVLGGKRGAILATGGEEPEDDLFQQALDVVINAKKASTSLLQRRLRIGYARAARIIESMEEKGFIEPADGARPREVLISSVQEALNPNQADQADDINEEDLEAESDPKPEQPN